ncbi:hypothetical protein D8S78_24110 [Natrialba swarupiae]|nr:hypothetical protein [Natrialba swarupiae]
MVHDETLYGVLNVYADRADAFDDTEIDLLQEVSDDIAYALNTVRMRRLTSIRARRRAGSRCDLYHRRRGHYRVRQSGIRSPDRVRP